MTRRIRPSALLAGLAPALAPLVLAAPARATMPAPEGTVPEAVSEAFGAGLFDLPSRPAGLGLSSVQSEWRIPVILVGFSDTPLTYGGAEFNQGLFDTTGAIPTGSVFDYFRWVSGGRLRVVGEVVATVQLPHDRYYYCFGSYGLSPSATPNNIYGAVRDALFRCERGVNWALYDLDRDGFVDMLWIVHAEIGGQNLPQDRNRFWSITSRFSGGWRLGTPFTSSTLLPGSTNQYIRLDRFSTLPEMSGIRPGARSEIGVYCHEFGHALGLPDLYDTSRLGGTANVGPGNWSLMATGASGPDGLSPESPSHLGAWPMRFLGWAPVVRPSQDTTLVLGPLAQGGPIVELWFQGEPNPEHFLLENRQRLGFDARLPSPGLLVYQVDEATIGQRLAANGVNSGLTPGLRVVEADGDSDLVVGWNRGDANDPFPGALGRTLIDDETVPSLRTFLGARTDLEVSEIGSDGLAMRFSLRVRARGWRPTEDATAGASFDPVGGYGPASRAVQEPDGTVHVIHSEILGGGPQVVLRSRVAGVWTAPLPLSDLPGFALDPSIALLPGGDLAVVWSDTRSGRARLYYRARIRNRWTAEQTLADLPGDARNPALGADPRGMVHLAWLQVSGATPRIMFMRFAYSSPFGQPAPVSLATQLPGAPSLAVAPDGRSYVAWPERSTPTQSSWFARFAPDSGVSAPVPLTPTPYRPQPAVTMMVDEDGTLHSVWLVNTPGESQLRYQRRPPSGPPAPPDSSIESQGRAIHNPVLRRDPQGGLHLTFELAHSTAFATRYRRWLPNRGWDYRSTELTRGDEGSATRSVALASSPGNVTVLYVSSAPSGARLMQRVRELDQAIPVAVPRADAREGAFLSLHPNPLRSGAAAEIRVGGSMPAGAALLEVYDLAGRRRAAVPLEGESGRRRGRLAARETATWTSGVYFVRVRGVPGPALRLVVLR